MAFRSDNGRLGEGAAMQLHSGAADPLTWRCHAVVERRWKVADLTHRAGDVERTEVIGNTLMNGGMSVLWERAITLNPTTSSTGGALQAFSSGNARIGVGNSTVAAAVTQTDLQGASKAYTGMNSSYPTHTDGTSSSGARQVVFKGSFSSSEANFAWAEFAVFNSTSGTKRMLQRKVQSLGTKTSAATADITVTLSVS